MARRSEKQHLADQLLDQVTNGPSFSLVFSKAKLSDEQKAILEKELKANHRLWSNSWIIPKLRVLVPQLAKKGETTPTPNPGENR
jgi:hypothetical protein